jgi:hypothetical protein
MGESSAKYSQMDKLEYKISFVIQILQISGDALINLLFLSPQVSEGSKSAEIALQILEEVIVVIKLTERREKVGTVGSSHLSNYLKED